MLQIHDIRETRCTRRPLRRARIGRQERRNRVRDRRRWRPRRYPLKKSPQSLNLTWRRSDRRWQRATDHPRMNLTPETLKRLADAEHRSAAAAAYRRDHGRQWPLAGTRRLARIEGHRRGVQAFAARRGMLSPRHRAAHALLFSPRTGSAREEESISS